MIPIALTADSHFYRGLLMAVASILHHTRSSDISFHVLDGGLSSRQKSELTKYVSSQSQGHQIQFHKISAASFEGFYLMYGNALPYARLLLPDLVPELEEILYGDADVYYGVDLGELWSIPLYGYSAAVVQDPVVETLGNDCKWIDKTSPDFSRPYFNSGVMKINLQYWREHRVTEYALNMARREPTKYLFWDQSLLNLLLKDSVQWIDSRFNHVLHRLDPVERGTSNSEGKNLHYIFKAKPWARYSRRISFNHWRRQYRKLISSWPGYQFSFHYWAAYLWADWIVMGRFIRPTCQFLLTTRLHKILPGLNESKLRAHLEN